MVLIFLEIGFHKEIISLDYCSKDKWADSNV